MLNKEKELLESSSKLNSDANQANKNLLEQFRQIRLNTHNFKGAQCLLNIKKKQILNRKTTTTTLNKLISPACTAPISIKLPGEHQQNSGSNTPSISSSISPSSTSSLSNYDNKHKKSPRKTPEASESSLDDFNSNNYAISYFDLNERLFSCLLSNFSCQLVENFLNNNSSNELDAQVLLKTGFIRKQKLDKSFTFINILNESSSSSKPSLNIDKNTIKFCLKLNKWPSSYKREFFERKRLNPKWPSQKLLDYIESNTCAISYAKSNEASMLWALDTRLAESVMFKSLNQTQTFIFYFFYLVFNNLRVDLDSSKVYYVFNFLNERMFAHHFYRFFELNKFEEPKSGQSLAIPHLLGLLNKFSIYMRFVLDKYKTLNKPNYFSLSRAILSSDEHELYLSKNVGSDFDACDALSRSFLKFESILSSSLSKLNSNAGILVSLNQLDAFLDSIQIRFSNNLNNLQLSSPILLNSSVNLELKTLETLLEHKNELYNHPGSPRSPNGVATKYFSPFGLHYSSNTYVYLYVYEFFNALFEQFKSKRDHFQISEQLIVSLHESILNSRQDDDDDKFIEAIKNVDKDMLLSKLEEYAECVHKYLQQIRQHNKYLLFHYIWTMQVQYLAPFFNYLCDFYPSIN